LAYGHTRTNCDVVISGGLGCSIMPFRLGVPPEIVLVTVGGKSPGHFVAENSGISPSWP
jgi:predicted MPP superfamily phosphohydrolase